MAERATEIRMESGTPTVAPWRAAMPTLEKERTSSASSWVRPDPTKANCVSKTGSTKARPSASWGSITAWPSASRARTSALLAPSGAPDETISGRSATQASSDRGMATMGPYETVSAMVPRDALNTCRIPTSASTQGRPLNSTGLEARQQGSSGREQYPDWTKQEKNRPDVGSEPSYRALGSYTNDVAELTSTRAPHINPTVP